jgi:hypothetical protein
MNSPAYGGMKLTVMGAKKNLPDPKGVELLAAAPPE